MEWLNFRHLYAFWSVCRHGGFRKASERIFVSQSTVSAQVAELEDYFGEALLERTTRALHVTDRGAVLLAYADEIFARSSQINHVFRDKNPFVTPTNIRAGMVGGVSRNFVFSLIRRTLTRERDAHFDIVDGSFDELQALLRSFEIDIFFSLDRPRQKDLITFSYHRVESSPLCIASTPDRIKWLKRKRKRRAEAELYVFRQAVEGPPLSSRVENQFSLNALVPVRTDDISLLRFLANAGEGFSVLPEIGVREDLDAGRLARVLFEPAPLVDVYAVFLTKGTRRPLIDRFLLPL